MKPARLVALVLAVAAQQAAAQDSADKTRLDEFNLPTDSAAPRVEQLDSHADALAPTAEAASDRELAVAGPPAQARGPVAQLSSPADAGPPGQLSDESQSRQLAAGSVSSPRDSRPQGAVALAGHDRCDPQADAERLAECQRILELRAAEFQAAEPPKLSAEQALLAAQGDLPMGSARVRLRLAASASPDADVLSNQELAAVYLASTNTPPAAVPAPEDENVDESMAQALEGLGVTVPAGGNP